MLEPAIPRLSDRKRSMLDVRFGQELSQVETAQRFGISQTQGPRVIRNAVARAGRAAV